MSEPDAARDLHTAKSAVSAMFRRDAIYMACSSSQLILGALATPVLTRVLGKSQYGILAFCLSLTLVVGQAANLGLPTGIQKEYSQDDGPQRARQILLFAFVAGAAIDVVGLTTIGLATTHHAQLSTGVLDLSFAGGVSTAFLYVALSLLRSEQRLLQFVWISTIASVGAQLLGIVLIILKAAATYYLGGLFAVQLTCCLVFMALFRPSPLRWPRPSHLGRSLYFSLPLIPAQMSTFVLSAGDRFVLQRDLGPIAVGRYSVTYNLGSWVILLIGLVSQAWMPRLFRITQPAMRWRVLSESRDQLANLVVLSSVAVSLAGPLVLLVWVPTSYEPSQLRLVMGLVAASAVPYAEFTNNVRLLNLLSASTKVALASTSAAVLNLALNFVLVPRFGLNGSAGATLISYGVAAVLSKPNRRQQGITSRRSVGTIAVQVGAVPLVVAIALLPMNGIVAGAMRCSLCCAVLAGFTFVLRRSIRRRPSPGTAIEREGR
jgi:O-antigen/teichoic acid export membrane protein